MNEIYILNINPKKIKNPRDIPPNLRSLISTIYLHGKSGKPLWTDDEIKYAQIFLSLAQKVALKDLYEWLKGAEKRKGSLDIFAYPSLEQYLQSKLPHGNGE